MKTATILFAACAVLFSVFMPVSPNPLPEIHVEGRNFNSRFAPLARPVFPRSYYENTTSPETNPGSTAVKREYPADSTAVKREYPAGPTYVKRDYPAGPTASALVFRSEHMDSPVKQR